MRKTRAIIWLLAVSHGVLWAAATPLWEGFDEPFHYGYIQHLALNRRLPVFGRTPVSEEIRISFENAPLSRVVNTNFGGRYTAFEQYWQMPQSEQLQRQENLARLPAAAAYQAADSGANPVFNNYEVHQPPLYYLIASLLYLPLADAGLLTRVLALRLLSMCIGLIAVALSFRLAERIWIERPAATSVPLMLALLPMFFATTVRISNDCLAVALFTGLLLSTLRLLDDPALPRRAITVGILLGLGLLTKAYFLTAVPALVVIVLLAGIDRKQALRILARIMVAAVLLAGWWYARNLGLYGNVSGMQEITLNASPSLAQRIATIARVPWPDSIATMIKQHIWVGNSSFIGLSRALYQTAYIIIVCAIAGMLITAVRGRMPPVVRTAAIFYLFFAAGLAYHMLVNFELIAGGGGTGGWYLYAVIVPEIVLLLCGLTAAGSVLKRWAPAERLAAMTAVTCALALHLVGTFCKALPFYAGFIIPQFHLQHLIQLYTPAAVPVLLERLAVNKAPAVTALTLGVLIVVHITLVVWCFASFIRSVAAARSSTAYRPLPE